MDRRSAILASVLLLPFTAQAQHAPAISLSPLPMPSTAPLYLESDSYTSTIYLVNQIKVGVQADVTLYDMSGALLTTKHLYLEPNSQQSASIKTMLSDSGLFSQVGSVEVMTPTHTSAVLGQLSITRTGTTKAYLDEELFMPEGEGSLVLRAVIDSPENSPIVALTDTSTKEAHTVHISCLPSTGGTIDKSFVLQPKQTKLVRACSTMADAVFSADAIDAQFILKPESQAGLSGQRVAGITITTNGTSGELAAFGFVEHSDDFGSYFSAMNFSDPKQLHSSGFAFTGVPVGPSQLLSATAYTPQVAITNFSALPQTVTVLLASSDSSTSSTRQVATATVPAGASSLLNLPGLTGNPDWQNSFLVRSSGQPGDVMAKMMFKGKGLLPNIELIPKDELDNHTAGDHPWTIENGTRSTLFLFNHAAKPRTVTVRVGSGNSVWLKMYDLQPNETRALSLGNLVTSGTADMHGHVLAKTLTNGEVGWWVPSDTYPELTGRVVQMDSAGSVARNFSCGNFVGLCQIAFANNPIILGFSSTQTIPSDPTYCSVFGSGPPSNGCSTGGEPTTQAANLSFTYNSANTSIATVSSNGGTSNWTGAGVGATTGTVNACTYQQGFQSTNCCQGSAPVNTIQVTQSPQTIAMLSGDTNKALNVQVAPASAASSVAIAQGLVSNQNSSSNASLTFSAPSNFTGNDSWQITVDGSETPSGVFTATACTLGVCASPSTAITVPPLVLVQVLYGEAYGQARSGDAVSEPAVGNSIKNRFGNSAFPGGSASTYQAVITSQQFNGFSTGQVVTNSSYTQVSTYELPVAVNLFTWRPSGYHRRFHLSLQSNSLRLFFVSSCS